MTWVVRDCDECTGLVLGHKIVGIRPTNEVKHTVGADKGVRLYRIPVVQNRTKSVPLPVPRVARRVDGTRTYNRLRHRPFCNLLELLASLEFQRHSAEAEDNPKRENRPAKKSS